MQYSIIIPAWNEAEYLPSTLANITAVMDEIRKDGVYEGELIVVDNNSTDDTETIARQFGAIVVFEPVNQIARARNAGAAVSQGQALIFLDADTSCSKNLLKHVLDQLASDAIVGGGSTIAPDQEIPPMAQACVSLWNGLSRTAKLAAGCFIYCRQDTFAELGGFNERVYAGEELFLSRQLKRWARKNDMTFQIVDLYPVVTSVRKLRWYSPLTLAKQLLLILIPGAVFSKRLCQTWYDTKTRRT